MEQFPQDNNPNELPPPQPERPVLRADLSENQSDLAPLIATAQELLRGDALEVFQQEIHEVGTPVAEKDQRDLLEVMNEHVELVDISNSYPQYAWKEKITAAVQWLNKQIETLPQNMPCSIDGLYPDFDDPNTGPEVYLNVLWSEVAQTEQLMGQDDGRQQETLEYYHDLLMTTIVKFWRYGLL